MPLSDWLNLCKREWKRMLGDIRIAFIFIGGPFFYAIIFGCVYWNGQTRHVPIVIADQDHSTLSREISSALQASDDISVVGWVNGPEDLLPLIRRDAAYACVVFPPGFERDVLAGKKPRVGILFDGSNTLIAATASAGVRTTLASYQIGLAQRRLEATLPPASALDTAMPLRQKTRLLFNPTSNYSYFILMGLVCIAVQSVTRIGGGISLELDSTAKLRREFPNLDLTKRRVFLFKAISTAALGLPIAFMALSFPFLIFGAPFRGSFLVLAAALVVFVFAQVCAGFGYSALCKSAVFCTQLHLYMSAVLFTLSGFTWPYYVMPGWVRWIANLTPLFHMNCLLRKTALIGASIETIWPHLAALAVLCGLFAAWGYWGVCSSMNRVKG
ncbi:MAG: ABC transporter permease [Terracidiphilus sp.]|jgi:ABC-2 type transport system permease protein